MTLCFLSFSHNIFVGAINSHFLCTFSLVGREFLYFLGSVCGYVCLSVFFPSAHIQFRNNFSVNARTWRCCKKKQSKWKENTVYKIRNENIMKKMQREAREIAGEISSHSRNMQQTRSWDLWTQHCQAKHTNDEHNSPKHRTKNARNGIVYNKGKGQQNTVLPFKTSTKTVPFQATVIT